MGSDGFTQRGASGRSHRTHRRARVWRYAWDCVSARGVSCRRCCRRPRRRARRLRGSPSRCWETQGRAGSWRATAVLVSRRTAGTTGRGASTYGGRWSGAGAHALWRRDAPRRAGLARAAGHAAVALAARPNRAPFVGYWARGTPFAGAQWFAVTPGHYLDVAVPAPAAVPPVPRQWRFQFDDVVRSIHGVSPLVARALRTQSPLS